MDLTVEAKVAAPHQLLYFSPLGARVVESLGLLSSGVEQQDRVVILLFHLTAQAGRVSSKVEGIKKTT